MRQPLDIYDDYPEDMKRYLKNYGWHFNKKACDFAISLMRKKDPTGKPTKVQSWSKEEVDNMLTTYGVTLEHNTGYDAVYVANMVKADNYKGSIADEGHVALHIKEVIDDIDVGDGAVMRCWYAKMVSKGEVIFWEEFL